MAGRALLVSVLAFVASFLNGAGEPRTDVRWLSPAPVSAQTHCPGRPTSCDVQTRDDTGCCPGGTTSPSSPPAGGESRGGRDAGRAPSAQAHAGTVPVNIESTPAGATVFLSTATGQNLGVTPLRHVRIPRGSHTLVFRLPLHRETSVTISVARRNETFRGVLDALGEITLSAANDSATGARVRMDGQAVGAVPMGQMVEPGRHLIQIDREGYATYTQWVHIQGGQRLALPVLLERQAASTGSVLVAADISGAAIYIDGDPRGSTPAVIDNVTAGAHRIEVRAEGFQPQIQRVEIRAGERALVEVQLRPELSPGGTLVVLTQPRGARVVLDGEVLGAGPVTRAGVSPGEHRLEVSMTGFQPFTQSVSIESGMRRAINIVLEEVVRAPGSNIAR